MSSDVVAFFTATVAPCGTSSSQISRTQRYRPTLIDASLAIGERQLLGYLGSTFVEKENQSQAAQPTMAGTSSPEQCRTRSSHRSLMLLLTLLAVQQQMQLSAAQVPDRVRQPGKIAVNPTAGESDEEGSMNARGQLQANGATIFAPAGPAMLNGVKVTSANFNKLAQQTPTTPSPPAKKASTLTPAGTIAGSTAAASTATSTPGLVNVRTSGTSGAALVNSAVSNPGTAGSGTFNTVQGGQTTSVAGQFAQQAPASAGTTRSAGTAGGAGGSGGSGGARLAGSVTSVAGGRKLLVNPLHLVVS